MTNARLQPRAADASSQVVSPADLPEDAAKLAARKRTEGVTMGKTCKHEADWSSTWVRIRDHEYCEVLLSCRHCGARACADIGARHFKWNDDGSPVGNVSAGSDDAENPPNDAA
jgi:hypothetical protein